MPRPLVTSLGALPLREEGNSVVLAVRKPLSKEVREIYQVLLGSPITEVVVEEEVYEPLAEHWSPRITDLSQVLWPDSWWAGEESLGQFLVSLGYITADQLQTLVSRGGDRVRLHTVLVESGALTEETIAEAISLWQGIPWIHVEQWSVERSVSQLIPQEFARRHGVLPISSSGSGLTVAMASPNNSTVIQELESLVGMRICTVATTRSSIARSLQGWYGEATREASEEYLRVEAELLKNDILSNAEAAQLTEDHLRSNEAPDQTAVRLGLVTEEQFARATASAFGLSYQDLSRHERFTPAVDAMGRTITVQRLQDSVDAREAVRLTEQQARAASAIPVRREGGRLLIAFAWPSGEHIDSVRSAIAEDITPVIAQRSQIEAAIARRLGRPRLGDTLVEVGLVTEEQLGTAAALGERTGMRLGEGLLSLGYITEVQLTAHMAEQTGLPFFDLRKEQVDLDAAFLIPKRFAAERQVLPISSSDGELLLAVADPTDRTVITEVEGLTRMRVQPVLVRPSEFAATYQELYREEDIKYSASDLMVRSPEDSASRVLTDRQKGVFLGALVVSVLLFAWQPLGFLIGLVVLVNLFYLTISFYKFYLIAKGLGYSLEIPITLTEVAALDERDLPVYTILIPLYRETEVLPKLVEAIGRLDYPKAKLDVKLLLEEDDTETIRVARASRLPSHFQIVIVPHGLSKGKPKACNYGLLQAKGSYTVIFDAEDVPEPDQLKKVIIAFRKGKANLGCIQCKLNYYNQDQNILTRWFTNEYSMWFDLFLPGLNASGAPIPLGGTSNHFPTIVLQDLGAWDPYNVTEDADLGIRLFKRGYTTAVVDSTTFEEANSDVYNWIRQRSRWVKGYIQTWLVHMRHPLQLYRAVGFKAFFSIQMTIFGTFFTFLVNPIFWGLTAVWFLTRWGLINELFPGPIFYVGAISLFMGNFIFTYMSMLGCIYRGYYSLVKYNLFVVLYWYLMSIAAWKGFIQLFSNPFYWEKTVHGLYKGSVVQEGKSNE